MIKIQIKMDWGAQSLSPEEINDSTPKTYICFCEKKFTTYPGIYLHMKSKHGNLFMKYKKLKITKLFRKTPDGKGGQIYRLQKISEQDIATANNLEGNSKQLKQNQLDPQLYRPGVRLPIEREPKGVKNNGVVNSSSRKKQAKDQQNLQVPNNMCFHSQFKNNFPPNGQMHFPPKPGPFPFGMPPVPHMFPPMYYQPPIHPNGFPQQRLTIKRDFDRFLMESNFGEKLMVRKTLYDLMVFIDNNYESINDPRAQNRIFLSYCDEFDKQFAIKLIHQYIGKKTQEKDQKNEETDNNQSQKQIDCLLRFAAWSMETMSMEFQMRRFPMPPEFDFQNSMFNDFLEEERKKKHEAEAIHGQMVKVAVEEVSDKQ